MRAPVVFYNRCNEAAARLSRRVADPHSTPRRPRFVAGNLGPTTKSPSLTGGITFDEMSDVFHDWAEGLVRGGVDMLILETQNDTATVKAALIGIWRLFDELALRVPVIVSATIEQTGTMLAGQSIDAFATSLMHADLLAIGLNCSTGPAFMTDHLRSLAGLTEFRTSCWPNAGLPDDEGLYCETPQQMAETLERRLRLAPLVITRQIKPRDPACDVTISRLGRRWRHFRRRFAQRSKPQRFPLETRPCKIKRRLCAENPVRRFILQRSL